MAEPSWAERLQAAWLGHGRLARGLWPLSCLYGAVVAVRRMLYLTGVMASHGLSVPVIVVGNLVVGGAGKTPTTLALIELLKRRGFTPAVVSRGHGRLTRDLVQVTRRSPVQETGDEPLLIHLRTGVPVAVGPDRAAAARALLRKHPHVDLLLSDDGLQHLQMRRDTQVIVFDERGVGNGWLLPAGPLREPFKGTQPPPRSVVVYNASKATTPWPGHLVRRRLGGLVRLAGWWAGEPAQPDAFDELLGRPVLAAAGVARPNRFFDMLRAEGLTITEMPLPDHHDFSTLPWPDDAGAVVVTEKDAVKLTPDTPGTAQVWVATLDFQFDAGFEDALVQCLPLGLRPGSSTAPVPPGFPSIE